MDAADIEKLGEVMAMMKELEGSGVSLDDVLRGTRTALLEKQKADQIAKQVALGKENKVTKNKIRVFEHTNECYIYQDGRNTKHKTWSIRIWDKKRKKPIVRSLKTVDQATALTVAREIYMNFTSRGAVYLSTDSITTKQLIALYTNQRREEMSERPQESITPRSLNTMLGRLKHWQDYINEKGYQEAKITDIPPEIGVDFAQWIRSQKITTGKRLGERHKRSNTTINQCVSATKGMYYRYALAKSHVTNNEIPKFTYLKKEKNRVSPKDVLQKDEASKLMKWMKDKYAVESSEIPRAEYIKRRIYNLTFTIHLLTGMRPAELLGTKWKDIRPVRDTSKSSQDNVVIHIDGDRGKTGKTRNLVAPIKPQLDRIKHWYKELEHHVEPYSDEFVFLKLTKSGLDNGKPQTPKAMGDRLKAVLKGATEDPNCPLNLTHLNITNYSARHYYITQQLFKDTNVHLVAEQVGTGIQYIENHYSHLVPEMKQGEICDAAADQDDLIYENRK